MPLRPLDVFYQCLQNQTAVDRFIRRKRDLVLVDFDEEYTFALACDSNASIGRKPNDYVQVDWKEVGRWASKVPLMEVLACGALPFVVVDNLCVEMEPAGNEILAGIRYEVERLGLNPDLVITGSAEKNMPTSQTGLGVTVLGMARRNEIKTGCSQSGDFIVCVGLPKSNPEVPFREGDPDVMDPPATRKLAGYPAIHDIIPVGSHGVRYEMKILAEESDHQVEEIPSAVDMTQSAGPSTCVLASLKEEEIPALRRWMTQPVNPVGILKKIG